MMVVRFCHCLVLLGIAASVSGKPASFSAKVALPGVEGVTSVNIGDINRDGLADIAMFEGGKHNKGKQYFAWFEAPDWTRHDFHSSKPGTFIGDTEMADMNGDGWLDIVLPRDNHSQGAGDLYWYENPRGDATGDWARHTIYADEGNTYHQGDIEIADMDHNGKLDVVCRHLGRRRVRVCLQNGPDDWTVRSFDVRDREGLKLVDLDRDGVVDIVMNGFWWAGPDGGWRSGDYTEHVIDEKFYSAQAVRLNNSTKNGIGDFNGDGRLDVGLASAEGNKVYLAVYLAPERPREEAWQRQLIKDNFGNCHQLEVGDVDLDGDLDLVGGRSFGESGVFVWYNSGRGTRWTEQIVDEAAGMYSGVISDLGRDGDIDIVAPHAYSKGQPVWIIENALASSNKRAAGR
jgi:hypothetical protein